MTIVRKGCRSFTGPTVPGCQVQRMRWLLRQEGVEVKSLVSTLDDGATMIGQVDGRCEETVRAKSPH